MSFFAVRLHPEDDLLEGMVNALKEAGITSAAIVTCVGSLYVCNVRLAAAIETASWSEELEIVSLVGTFSDNGPHVHISVSEEGGHVKGGHLLKGSLIRTTAEVVFAVLDSQYHFTREFDKNTGWNELVVHPKK